MGAVVDDLGAWVALDVQGAELQPLVPGMLVTWSPRPGRACSSTGPSTRSREVVIVPGELP